MHGLRVKVGAVALGLVGFIGCSASTGNDGEAPVETAEVAATTCESFTGTIAQHEQAGRVRRFTFFVFIFPVTSYSVVGSNEDLGSDPNKRVTLYRLPDYGFTTSAVECAAVCGDGKVDRGEECDGAPTTTCAEHALPVGTVKCTSACRNDISECRTSGCGDGVINPDLREQCEGSNLGAFKTCSEYRSDFNGGTLKCNAGCQYDLSGCTKPCGNGVIDGDEQCDGTARAPQFANVTCQTADYPDPAFPFFNRVKFPGGTLACNDCKLQPMSCTQPTGCFYRSLSPNNLQVYCQ